jgi:tetrahydromethanopterin S-methyltransferase subunit G
VRVRASAPEEDSKPQPVSKAFDLDAVLDAVDKVAQRYDWLSAGLGALAGTSYGVYRGQPVGQALGITLCATVVALAVDEAIKDQEARRDESE